MNRRVEWYSSRFIIVRVAVDRMNATRGVCWPMPKPFCWLPNLAPVVKNPFDVIGKGGRKRVQHVGKDVEKATTTIVSQVKPSQIAFGEGRLTQTTGIR